MKKKKISSYSERIIRKIERAEDAILPSKYEKRMWVFANSNTVNNGIGKINKKEQGKWLIFAPPEAINKIWHKVRSLYKSNELIGMGGAKCSTKKSVYLNPDGYHVIVIYCLLKKEIIHNRKVLREKAGITWKISYKLEKDTGKKYSWNGDTNISKYYE